MVQPLSTSPFPPATSHVLQLALLRLLACDNRSAMSLRTVIRQLHAPLKGVLQSRALISRRTYSAAAQARSVLENELDTIRADGTWKGERVITSQQGAHIIVDGSHGGEDV